MTTDRLRQLFGANAHGAIRKVGAYALVAIITFAVDALILRALVFLAGFDPFSGRLISLPIALFVNWILNRSVVFPVNVAANRAEVVRYLSARAFSATTNYGIYSLLLLAAGPQYALDPAIAVAIATVVTMAPNYLIMRYFVFRG